MSNLPLSELTTRLFESIFGAPMVATDLVRMWCRTLHRTNPNANLGELLFFLATAPAVPCVRHHLVGGTDSHAVYFYPFGTQGRLAPGLHIPLVNADVRVTRAVQFLLANETAFPQVTRDPVFGYRTYYCFAYTVEAQRALDACRPVFLASAVCAVLTQIRLEIKTLVPQTSASAPPFAFHSTKEDGVISRVAYEKRVLARPLTYYQAACEAKCFGKVSAQIRACAANLDTPYHVLGFRLLVDAIRFVREDKLTESIPFDLATLSTTIGSAKTRKYPVLPTTAQILQFGQETTPEWQKALTMTRITTNTSATTTT